MIIRSLVVQSTRSSSKGRGIRHGGLGSAGDGEIVGSPVGVLKLAAFLASQSRDKALHRPVAFAFHLACLSFESPHEQVAEDFNLDNRQPPVRTGAWLGCFRSRASGTLWIA